MNSNDYIRGLCKLDSISKRLTSLTANLRASDRCDPELVAVTVDKLIDELNIAAAIIDKAVSDG
jgi:hypothetical protein